MKKPHPGYPSDVSDEEWAFAAPYLTLMREAAPQRAYPLRHLFNAVRYLARTGVLWRYLPGDFPAWPAVYQQLRRWLEARCFESMVDDLRQLLRMAQGHAAEPSAILLDSRTLQSTPESGHRAGYDGAKRRKGSKVHIAVDTLGHLLAALVSPANDQDRAQVAALAEEVQAITSQSVTLAYVDQGYTGQEPAQAAAKRGFVLLPKRWVVERSFAWAARFRRLARDYECLTTTLEGIHYLVFAYLMLVKANHINLLSH
jgi:transposase